MQSTRASIALTAAFLFGGSGGPLFAAPGSGQACAPPGVQVPHLFVHPMPASAGFRLRLVDGPSLGNAIVLLEDPSTFGLPDPRPLLPGCAAGVRGGFVVNVFLDAAGSFDIVMPYAAVPEGPSVSVLCIPPAGGLGDSSLSNSFVLTPPQFDASGAPGGPHAAITGSGTQAPELVIVEFMKDPSTVSDTHGEWIELWNPTGQPVNVEGFVLSDFGTDVTVLSNGGAGMLVPGHGFLVLGRDSDPMSNGGVPVDYEFSGMTLSNGDDEIVLSTAAGILIDLVQYDDGVLWPDSAGRSISLDPGAFGVAMNDDGTNWCDSSTPLGPSNGDTGTPGAMNDVCP